MQANGALQGGSTIPKRGRLRVLLAILAIVVIAAMMALLMWASPFATSGVGAEDAISSVGTGSTVVHDDAGYVHRSVGSAVAHDDAGNVHRH